MVHLSYISLQFFYKTNNILILKLFLRNRFRSAGVGGGLDFKFELSIPSSLDQRFRVPGFQLTSLHSFHHFSRFSSSHQSLHVSLAGTKTHRTDSHASAVTLRTLGKLVRVLHAFSVQSFPFTGSATHIARNDTSATTLDALGIFQRKRRVIVDIFFRRARKNQSTKRSGCSRKKRASRFRFRRRRCFVSSCLCVLLSFSFAVVDVDVVLVVICDRVLCRSDR